MRNVSGNGLGRVETWPGETSPVTAGSPQTAEVTGRRDRLRSMQIIDGAPLLISATEEEAAHAPKGVPLLITGIGTIACSIALTEALSAAKAVGKQPSRLINFGTAGALQDGMSGIYEISSVLQHDFDSELLARITGKTFPDRLPLETTGVFPTACLATGDSFVADTDTRIRLSADADLAEMEGYAVARVAGYFGLPVTLLKQVSDRADENAPREWGPAVAAGARELGAALKQLLG